MFNHNYAKDAHTHKYMLAPWCVLCCQLSTHDCTMVCAMLSAVYTQLHHGVCYAVTLSAVCIQLHHGMCYAVSCLHTNAPWCVLCCQLSAYDCTMVCAMLSAVCIWLHHGVCYAVTLSDVCIWLHHGVCYAVSCQHTIAPWCVLRCQLSTYNCTIACAVLQLW